MDWPPVPVAWNTRQSNRSASSALTRFTQGVVTPNMVRPTAGRSSATAGRGARAMPATACAALARMVREMRLSPATSVTEYIIAMSLGPT